MIGIAPAQLGDVSKIFRPSGGLFVGDQRVAADELNRDAVNLTRRAVHPGRLEFHSRNRGDEINAVRLDPELQDLTWLAQIVNRYVEAPEPKSLIARRTASAFSIVDRMKKSMSAVKRGYPCHATANPPTTRYSTLFELSDSINSRKSLFSRIGIDPLLEFEYDVNALLGGRLPVFFEVGCVGFLVTAEDANDFLHIVYFTWFLCADGA